MAFSEVADASTVVDMIFSLAIFGLGYWWGYDAHRRKKNDQRKEPP